MTLHRDIDALVLDKRRGELLSPRYSVFNRLARVVHVERMNAMHVLKRVAVTLAEDRMIDKRRCARFTGEGTWIDGKLQLNYNY